MERPERNLAETAAVIAEYIADNNIQLGNEGRIMHYHLLTNLIEDANKQYPHTFDWETHALHGGHCWDITLQEYADEWIREKYPECLPS